MAVLSTKAQIEELSLLLNGLKYRQRVTEQWVQRLLHGVPGGAERIRAYKTELDDDGN